MPTTQTPTTETPRAATSTAAIEPEAESDYQLSDAALTEDRSAAQSGASVAPAGLLPGSFAHAATAIDEDNGFGQSLFDAVGPELLHGGYEPGPTLDDLWAAKDAARVAWEDFGRAVETTEGRLRLHAYATSYKRFMLGIAQLPHDVCVEYDGLSFSRDDSDKWPFGAATRRKVDGASVRVMERTGGAGEKEKEVARD